MVLTCSNCETMLKAGVGSSRNGLRPGRGDKSSMIQSERSARGRSFVACAVLLLVGCETLPPPAAVHPRPLPTDSRARELALGQIGRQLYKALSDGEP